MVATKTFGFFFSWFMCDVHINHKLYVLPMWIHLITFFKFKAIEHDPALEMKKRFLTLFLFFAKLLLYWWTKYYFLHEIISFFIIAIFIYVLSWMFILISIKDFFFFAFPIKDYFLLFRGILPGQVARRRYVTSYAFFVCVTHMSVI